jgi:cobaltochelatase CobN
VQQTGAALVVLPGDDRPDLDLVSHSTVSLTVVNQFWRYLTEGGTENFVNALQFIADECLGQSYSPLPPTTSTSRGVVSVAIRSFPVFNNTSLCSYSLLTPPTPLGKGRE